MSEFRVRWKGKESGPYSLAELKRRLARGELSTLHRVEFQGRWLPADRVIAALESPDSPAPEMRGATGPIEAKLAYFTCGLACLLPGVATLVAALVTRRVPSAEARRELAALNIAFTLVGILLWFLNFQQLAGS